MSVILIPLIDVKNGLVPVARDIVNTLCMVPCAENIWSFCVAEFVPKCGAVVVLKRALYVLNTA